MASEKSPGQVLEAVLADSLTAYQMGPVVGGHAREIVWGVTPDGSFVLGWVQQGKPKGSHKHRCDRWTATVGGILDANGLGAFFLANADEAEAQMDQGLVDLATLAEHAVTKDLADLYLSAGEAPDGKGMASGQWVPVVAETQVLRDKFADATPKGTGRPPSGCSSRAR